MQDTQENKNNNKFLYAFIVLFGYVIYSNFTSLTSIKNDIADIQIVLQVLKDKVEIKEKDLSDKRQVIQKTKANILAFTDTGCARCHLAQESLMLPLPNKTLLDFEEYKRVVRQGIEGKMPSYTDRPTKTIKDITDGELSRQYTILKNM